MRYGCFSGFGLVVAALAVAFPCLAADEPAAPSKEAKTYQQTVDQAVQFLKTKQAADGSFAASSGPGVSAVVTTGLLRVGLSTNDPTVAKALKYLETFVQRDGGIYAERTASKTMKPRWPWSVSRRPTPIIAMTSW